MYMIALFYICGLSSGFEEFLGVFNVDCIDKAIETNMKRNPFRSKDKYKKVDIITDKLNVYRRWEW